MHTRPALQILTLFLAISSLAVSFNSFFATAANARECRNVDGGRSVVVSSARCTSVFAFEACGDLNGELGVTASDALIVLRGTVGSNATCDGNCNCDLDCSKSITATDALIVLRWAVGGEGGGCCTADECFNDTDCEPGFYCGDSVKWCDAVCRPEGS